MGGYLCQKVDGKEVPIAIMSKTFSKEQKRWSVPEKECYALRESVRKFDYLLRDAPFELHTDHANLIYIRDSGSPKVIRWKLELQEYQFNLHHVAGVHNIVADFFSRNKEAEEDDGEVDQPTQISRYLARLTIPETVDEELPLDQEAMQCNAVSWEIERIPPEAYEKIQKCHNSTVGHHGREATIAKLLKQHEPWPYMRNHVRKFIRECDCCQKMTDREYPVVIKNFTTSTYQPMERIAIDTIGPLTKDPEGFEHAVVIIDTFTRFTAVYPTKTTEAVEAAEALLIHSAYFGAPCQIMSDRGSQYVNAVIQAYLDFQGTEHVLSIAYSKQENSIVERANKEIRRWIRDMLYSKKMPRSAWRKAIPFVIRIHNASPIEPLKVAPADLVFGQRINLDRGILIPAAERTEELEEQSLQDWMREHLTVQDAMIERAQELLQEHHKKHVTKVDPDTAQAPVPTEFSIGSYVLVDWPGEGIDGRGRPDKLMATRQGPFQVEAKSDEGNAYVIRNLVTGKTMLRQVHLLRPYYYDVEHTDPNVEALKDFPDRFHVEKIVAHKGRWNYKQTLAFEVKWEGYSKDENTWEPWKNLMYNVKLHQYMKQIGEEGRIPKPVKETAKRK